MNSNALSSDASIGPSIKRKIKNSSNHFHGTFQTQNWPFQDAIINYITKHPSSPKVYQKMLKCCKYFFIKNPIIIVEEMTCNSRGAKLTYLKKTIEISSVKNISSKFWITHGLYVFDGTTINNLSSIIPCIFHCEIKKLYCFNQIISWNEFLFLSSNIVEINFKYSNVKQENGSILPLENLVTILPNIKEFWFCIVPGSSVITAKTVTNLLKIPHFLNMDYFSLHYVNEFFDIETFFVHLKKNKHTKYCLSFSSISEAYKNRLEEIVNEILATVNPEFKIPLIECSGIDGNIYRKLRSLYSEQ